MSLKIGRATFEDPRAVTVQGDTVTFSLDLLGTSLADLQAIRQQLLGLDENDDEAIVPVTWSEDSAFDGFYEVLSVDVPTSDAQLLDFYITNCRVALERVAGYSNPTFEAVATNVTRTNSHAMSGAALLYLPGSVTYDIDGLSGIAASDTRAAADGTTVTVLTAGDPNGKSYRFDVAAADYYKAACSIEVEYSGTWYPVVGRQIPRATRFRISNGIVRLTSASSGTGATFEIWNGSAWVSWNVSLTDGSNLPYALGRTTPSMNPGLSARDIPVTVLRNSPEQVTVRQTTFSDSITFTLQRGHRHLTIHWTVATNVTGTASVGVGLSGAGTGGTATTGGIYTTTGSSSTQVIFANTATVTNDTANTRTRNTTGALSGTMFIGGFVGGGTGLNTITNTVLQMMSGVNWRQRVVAR